MLDWQQIDTLFLDMDGTLLDLHFDNHFWLEHLPRKYALSKGCSLEDARRHIQEKTDSQSGTLNWYCLDYWSAELQVDIPTLKTEIEHLIRFRPHVQDFLLQLKRTSHRVVLTTNAHHKSLEIKLRNTGLQQYLDRIISAHDLGFAKEETGFWEQLQMIEPFDRERTALIDDSLAVLRAAQRYGIRYLLAIAQPDSSQPARQTGDFGALDCFTSILPDRKSGHE
jgi:HAD superfamily hydrolase (TIGR01509 family)